MGNHCQDLREAELGSVLFGGEDDLVEEASEESGRGVVITSHG